MEVDEARDSVQTVRDVEDGHHQRRSGNWKLFSVGSGKQEGSLRRLAEAACVDPLRPLSPSPLASQWSAALVVAGWHSIAVRAVGSEVPYLARSPSLGFPSGSGRKLQPCSMARLIFCVHHTNDYRQCCHVGNTAQHCRLGLFQGSDFAAGDLEDSESTSGVSCILEAERSSQSDVHQTFFSFS